MTDKNLKYIVAGAIFLIGIAMIKLEVPFVFAAILVLAFPIIMLFLKGKD